MSFRLVTKKLAYEMLKKENAKENSERDGQMTLRKT